MNQERGEIVVLRDPLVLSGAQDPRGLVANQVFRDWMEELEQRVFLAQMARGDPLVALVHL